MSVSSNINPASVRKGNWTTSGNASKTYSSGTEEEVSSRDLKRVIQQREAQFQEKYTTHPYIMREGVQKRLNFQVKQKNEDVR